MKNDKSKVSYDETFNKLEKIVDKMSDGDIPLEEGLKLFEDGMSLINNCNETLSYAELKVKKLRKKLISDSDNNFSIKDLK